MNNPSQGLLSNLSHQDHLHNRGDYTANKVIQELPEHIHRYIIMMEQAFLLVAWLSLQDQLCQGWNNTTWEMDTGNYLGVNSSTLQTVNHFTYPLHNGLIFSFLPYCLTFRRVIHMFFFCFLGSLLWLLNIHFFKLFWSLNLDCNIILNLCRYDRIVSSALLNASFMKLIFISLLLLVTQICQSFTSSGVCPLYGFIRSSLFIFPQSRFCRKLWEPILMGCCLAASMACFSLGINKLKTTYENSPTRNITNMQTHGTNACMVTMLITKTGGGWAGLKCVVFFHWSQLFLSGCFLIKVLCSHSMVGAIKWNVL